MESPFASSLTRRASIAGARGAALAKRLAREAASPDARVDLAFRLAVGRAASPAERAAAREFLDAQALQYAGLADPNDRLWADFGQMLLAGNSFLYVE